MRTTMLSCRSWLLVAFILLVGSLNILVLLTTENNETSSSPSTMDDFDFNRNEIAPAIHHPRFQPNSSAAYQHQSVNETNSNVKNETTKRMKQNDGGPAHVARLSCAKYGGPSDEEATEMVYWSNITSDANYVSPYKRYGPKNKYLTFEIDEGGWNNIRMSMETAVAMAYAMGRTLVMPPSQKIYLLNKKENRQKNSFGFGDFFPFYSIESEAAGLDIISTKEFLEREIMSGNLKSKWGDFSFPPGNRTDWNGVGRLKARPLDLWIRNAIAQSPMWECNKCLVVIPKTPGQARPAFWHRALHDIRVEKPMGERINSYTNNATPVDAPTRDRLTELLSTRNDICLYDEQLQNAPVVHFMGDNNSGARLLVHFYVFLFFAEWEQDVRIKRFVRDRLRYVDEIQCAAARVVAQVRKKSREKGNSDGTFDSLHIRRGDFQYNMTRLEPLEIYENIKDVILENATVFVATDERNLTFFDPLRQHYNLFFLADFKHVLEGVNTNYYGMIDQLVASRGYTFSGTFYSTFTGYINRIRGYHSQKSKTTGYRGGRLRSYYIFPKGAKNAMSYYMAIRPYYWAREWPVGWRDIDKGIEEATDSQ